MKNSFLTQIELILKDMNKKKDKQMYCFQRIHDKNPILFDIEIAFKEYN